MERLHREEQERLLAADCLRHALGEEARRVTRMKAGMTNDSFLAETEQGKYVVRLNGIGSERLISRTQEEESYKLLAGLGISDEVISMDTRYRGGYKIARYLEGARVCDPHEDGDVRAAMRHLRRFHSLRLQAAYDFDVFAQIPRYEALWAGRPPRHADYEKTRSRVLSLVPLLAGIPVQRGLSHIDAVPDNILFAGGKTYLIDWEYAAVADQHLDLAMFAVYAGYGEAETRRLLVHYFEGEPKRCITAKVFSYMAAAGLLWSSWCAYKELCGETFGHYAEQQYEYAREFSVMAKKI